MAEPTIESDKPDPSRLDPSKQGLSFSGGGFRATLFHLGVVKLLRDAGILSCIRRVGAVSGGSILAAHLVLHWDRYTGSQEAFAEASGEILDFCRSDVRGNVTRGWLLAWLLLLPRLLKRRHWTFTNLLQTQYAKLFRDATLADLHPTPQIDRPQVVFYSTSLSTGCSCAFGRSGFVWTDAQDQERNVVAPEIPVAFAVAASSAFPPLFPPIAVTNDELFCGIEEFEHPHYLTDGGVFDNLGVNRMLWYQQASKDLDGFIVSDAEGEFDWEFHNNYKLITSRNIRASDVLMKRVSTLQYEILARNDVQVAKVGIGRTVLRPNDPTVLSPAVQRGVRNIRTDLDAFTETEIAVLLQHGYTCARETLLQSKLIQDDAPHYEAEATWPTASVIRNLPLTLRQSRFRKLGLWSASDAKSWGALGASCVLLAILAMPWYWRILVVERNARTETEARVLSKAYSTAVQSGAADLHPGQLRNDLESIITPETAAAHPRLYLQIASASQRSRMQNVMETMKKKQYLVPGIEIVGSRAPAENELRYFRDSDRTAADAAIVVLAEKAGVTAKPVKLQAPPNSQVQQLELWVSPGW